MKSKATSPSSPSIWAEAERRIVQAYSEIQEIWYRSLDLQVDLSNRLQSETTVSEKNLKELARVWEASLKKLREGFSKVRPYLSEADSKYTIFSDLEDLIVEYLESLKLLPKEKDAFLGQTGHKNTRYTFWNLAYIAERREQIRVNGELLLFVSPLANLLDELLYEMPLDYTDDEVDFLIRQRVEKERGYLLQRLPGVVSLAVSKEQSKPKRGRRPKADLKSRDNRELLIAILKQHHRYESSESLRTDPISTEEACRSLGKSGSTLSKTWREIKPNLTYAGYVKLCGHYESLRKFLKAIDSKEGYLERSNREGVIDHTED